MKGRPSSRSFTLWARYYVIRAIIRFASSNVYEVYASAVWSCLFWAARSLIITIITCIIIIIIIIIIIEEERIGYN